MKKKLIMLIAGEPSGDLHGANLMRNLKKVDNSLDFIGAGGKKMEQEGLIGITDMDSLAVVGIKEIFGKYASLKQAFRRLTEIIEKNKPDCLILIDYPGFNLRMAKIAKEKNVPVFYYISPQIWAWGRNRIKKIKKYVDKMFVILPFEKEFYSQYGVNAEFLGHPLLDIVKPNLSKEQSFSSFGFNPNEILIGLLPGSRWEEVKLSIPIMAQACKIIAKEVPNVKFGILVSENIDVKKIESLVPHNKQVFHFIKDKNYNFINICDLVLVNSGTATLEVAILGKPMLIIYKLSFLSWLILKMLVKIPYIGLANIIKGEKIVPEFIQFAATPSKVAKEALSILVDENRIITIQKNLSEVKAKLGKEGASEKTAQAILEEIQKKYN
ncbi:MAG: lipid-A-disaccharide synthase [Candidatus Omnitrophica bacterium]|nr:lipid-A-disaccharide synthase [Candidatus Omnitrophota bacterium]MBU1630760.1 lipid-A-disaccharide synthase [Candidatus Omnitrophota bacterium]MBU1889019.1 lipid-A-disaccharide synthase [Candidatus Omnitrophota bacterium]